MRKSSVFIISISLFICLTACETSEKQDEITITTSKKSKQEPYRFEIISLQNGFGYQLFENNKLIIDQQTIPAVQGNQAFENYESAKKCAAFCLDKIKKGIFPPTITVEELNQLGIKL
ncbi:MAG: DUF4907 domain-containing protein [Crocinitomicaceae bacterium]|nr:DUF4907 domain-containing protein [Crocinitomicaceae bacterium]